MSLVLRAFWNPIVAKEYRSRMRTWRSPAAMMVYILLLGGLGWAIFSAMAASARNSYNQGQAANYGQNLFLYLILFQVVLLAFITPALTAGAISGERERQTIDLLFVTRIPPFSILWGKLLASMSFVLLLLLLSVPIFSLVFLFGGIELDQVVDAFLVTAVSGLTLGILGIACSTWFARTLPATVTAYVAAFLLLVGCYGYGVLFPTEVDPQSPTPGAPPAVTYLSPALSLVSIATNAPISGYGVRYRSTSTLTQGGPFGYSGGGGYACSSTNSGLQTCFATPVIGASVYPGKPYYGPTPQLRGTVIPSGLFTRWQYWQATSVMQLAVCLVALLVSAFLLPPVRHLPWRRRARAVYAAPGVAP
jgi:ABC-2 type transport system permease protein